MKCPMCGGIGLTDLHTPNVGRCIKCNGSGEFEPTNEEWLCSISTEEKAKWIAKQKCDGCNDEPYDDKHGTCKYCMAKKTEQVREWLKQPHSFE